MMIKLHFLEIGLSGLLSTFIIDFIAYFDFLVVPQVWHAL